MKGEQKEQITCYAHDDCDHGYVSASISASVTSAEARTDVKQTNNIIQDHTSKYYIINCITLLDPL